MPDLNLEKKCMVVCNEENTSLIAYEIKTTSGTREKRYFGVAEQLTLECDKNENYFALRINNANAYRYTPGDTFNSGSVADAQGMFDAVQAFLIS